MSTEPVILLDDLMFPEGPRWHDGELWFSDLGSGSVRSVDLEGRVQIRAILDDRPSGIGFLPDGDPIVVSMGRRVLLRLDGATPQVHADLGPVGRDFLNDMLIDPEGRAYVGCRSEALRPARRPIDTASDAIAIVEPDGTVRPGAASMTSPNGTVLTADGTTLIVAETYAQRVLAFARATDGSLGDRRVFADLPGRYPDGICLDDTGAVWVASPYTHEFVRVRDGGEVTDRIPMPGGVACALGGPRRDTLFLLAVDPSRLPAVEDADGDGPGFGPDLRGRIATVPVAHPAAGWQ
jgi:sugar lactone lactonase YvrE